jgi:hypothetical protein
LERGKRKKGKSQQKRRATAPVAPFPICQVDAAENGSRNALCIVHVTHRGKKTKKKEEEEIEKETPAHTQHSPAHCVINDQAKRENEKTLQQQQQPQPWPHSSSHKSSTW